MKLILKLIIFIIIIAGGVYLYFLITSPVLLSPDQEEVRAQLGMPEEFMVTYLPRGTADDPQAVRSEVWYYPKHGKQVNWLAGELVAIEEFAPENEIVAGTSLRPEDFDIYMDYNDVAAILGELNIERFDIPGFFEDGVETYASDQALFIIEDGYLTYIQTIGAAVEDLASQAEELDSLDN